MQFSLLALFCYQTVKSTLQDLSRSPESTLPRGAVLCVHSRALLHAWGKLARSMLLFLPSFPIVLLVRTL